jgi:hypothetical protein
MSQPDARVLSRFLAKQIVKSAKKGAPAEEDLALAISEVELETQIAGASFIKVTVIDPEWAIITSGWIDVVEGLVDQIEVEFPEKSGQPHAHVRGPHRRLHARVLGAEDLPAGYEHEGAGHPRSRARSRAQRRTADRLPLQSDQQDPAGRTKL